MAQTMISRARLSPDLPRFSDLTLTQRHYDAIKVNTNSSRVVIQPQLELSATSMQVVHATNGRIRIKATDGSFSSNVQSITQYLGQYPGVKEVTTNEQTGTIVVSFDQQQISLSQMLGVLQRLNIPTSQNRPLSDPFAAWKSVDFWKEQTISFIPLMTGLAVTSRLGISGLASIPVYMMTADATRRVIDYLKPRLDGLASGKSADAEHQSANPENQTSIVKKHSETIKWSAKVTYSVIHQIPGRIRFHVPMIASDRAYAMRLERVLQTDSLVKSVRINVDAASVAITYKPSTEIAVSHWVSLMESAWETTKPTVAVSTTAKPTPSTTVSISEPETENQLTQSTDATISASDGKTIYISSWWADMKAPALSYSLAIMANLPL
ncbi:HMA2 domain-containing protein [Anabaena sp. CA = ATCC 33047]|uniref:HMA2 domain-containing protein n=1 Tax=Anabaena sp. (strain CA / ATCC 33047) TaxID=52271 RepID=UPI00082DF573